MGKFLGSQSEIGQYMTRDGSLIRELMHPDKQAVKNQSLAEAITNSGRKTLLHKHILTGEMVYICRGKGRMTFGADQFEVSPGDSITISPRNSAWN